jgi:hypothetical protein
MNQFQVTFKRVEAFYQTIIVEAPTLDEARGKADQLSSEGTIEFDYLKESDLLDEYIIDIEKL